MRARSRERQVLHRLRRPACSCRSVGVSSRPEDREQRRLAAARGPGDRDVLALLDLEVDAGERVRLDLVGVEDLGQALELDQRGVVQSFMRLLRFSSVELDPVVARPMPTCRTGSPGRPLRALLDLDRAHRARPSFDLHARRPRRRRALQPEQPDRARRLALRRPARRRARRRAARARSCRPRSGRGGRPCGSSPLRAMSTVTVPFWTAGSTRDTAPVDECRCACRRSPSGRSGRPWPASPATRITAFSFSGCATRARFVPGRHALAHLDRHQLQHAVDAGAHVQRLRPGCGAAAPAARALLDVAPAGPRAAPRSPRPRCASRCSLHLRRGCSSSSAATRRELEREVGDQPLLGQLGVGVGPQLAPACVLGLRRAPRPPSGRAAGSGGAPSAR